VSLFLFDESAAGFYLDGKLKSLCADTSLVTLQKHLKDSRTGATAGRGLSGNNENAYMLFVGSDLHKSYTQEKNRMRRHGTQPKESKLESLAHTLKRVANESNTAVRDQRYAATARIVLEFCPLRALLGPCRAAADPSDHTQIKQPNLWEKWMRSASVRGNVAPAHTVLATDAFHMWSKTIFYGQELRLILFELMLFSAIDLALRNVALSASITWFVGLVITWLRGQLGRSSLATGTFVDELFLK